MFLIVQYVNVQYLFNLYSLTLPLSPSQLSFLKLFPQFLPLIVLHSSSQSNNDDSATSADGDTVEVKSPSSSEKRHSSKGSIVGALLPSLLAVMSDPVHCTLPLAMKLLPCGNSLGRRNAEV